MTISSIISDDDNELSQRAGYDSLAFRLSHIITRLFIGDKLLLSELALDFNVSERTIYRDLRERLVMLDIECHNKRYFLSKQQFGARLTVNDLVRFAKMTYVDKVFPALDNKLASILTLHHISPFIIYAYPPKNNIGPFGAFLLITEAILAKQCLVFDIDTSKESSFNEKIKKWVLAANKTLPLTKGIVFKPYRLVYINQEWFLVGCHLTQLSIYRYSSMLNVKKLTETFDVNISLLTNIIEEESFIQSLPHYELLSTLCLLGLHDGVDLTTEND